MGLFGFGKKKDVSSNVESVSRGEVVASTITLEKSMISLDKAIISLEKKSGVSFFGHKAKVAVVLDYSGSMGTMYRSGKVQTMLERVMPVALKFDDNGELDVWLFEGSFARLPKPVTMQNYVGYVDREVLNGKYRMGSTSYSPVLKDVLKKYFVEDKSTSDIPTFVIFVTDGNNDDKKETDAVVRESAEKNIFIQFVGIGSESFSYLEKLDNLSGRKVDNTGFIKVNDMTKVPDEDLYDMLLDQYPDWLKAKGQK